MKQSKAFLSRVRKTKNGILITRKAGHGHFNSKESRSKQLNKKRAQKLIVSPKVKQRFF